MYTAQYRTLDKSCFTRYQNNTAMIIWSGCIRNALFLFIFTPSYPELENIPEDIAVN